MEPNDVRLVKPWPVFGMGTKNPVKHREPQREINVVCVEAKEDFTEMKVITHATAEADGPKEA